LIDEILHDKTLHRLDEKTQRELDEKVRELLVLREKSDEEVARFRLESRKNSTAEKTRRPREAAREAFTYSRERVGDNAFGRLLSSWRTRKFGGEYRVESRMTSFPSWTSYL